MRHHGCTVLASLSENSQPCSNKPRQAPKNDDELEKKQKELEARLDAEDSKKVQADLLKKVTAAMKAKQANDDYVLSKTLQGVTFDTKKTVDELVTEFLPKYDAEYKVCRGYGTAPRTSDGSGGTQHNAAEPSSTNQLEPFCCLPRLNVLPVLSVSSPVHHRFSVVPVELEVSGESVGAYSFS